LAPASAATTGIIIAITAIVGPTIEANASVVDQTPIDARFAAD
jgi:hypothetical protein